MLLILNSNAPCNAQLSSTFYDQTCPNALSAIRTSIQQSISLERQMTASLIRLHFHDCFGCDASILLDESATPTSERSAGPNKGSIKGYEVVEAAKSAVKKVCPGVVSCADILAVAARDASVYVGGPSWTAKLGRRDSTKASRSLAESDLPSFTSGLGQLIPNFARKGLNDHAPSARHNASHFATGYTTMGATLTPALLKKGLLPSDQVLFNGGSTDNIVLEYSKNPSTFNSDFALSLTGQDGVIRRICSALN
ncbi:hypothetical protein CsSME_00042753 [Camellia sinensis var. sinensis]